MKSRGRGTAKHWNAANKCSSLRPQGPQIIRHTFSLRRETFESSPQNLENKNSNIPLLSVRRLGGRMQPPRTGLLACAAGRRAPEVSVAVLGKEPLSLWRLQGSAPSLGNSVIRIQGVQNCCRGLSARNPNFLQWQG